jgi:hypothetical protein
MRYVSGIKWAGRSTKFGCGAFASAFIVMTAWVLPTQAYAAAASFSLTWTNSKNSTDTFSGTLSVDSDLFPNSGVINLASTNAVLSVTIPQLGGKVYTMADFSTFSIGLSHATVSNFSVGQNLISTNLVSQALIYGKVGSSAHNNFNGCNNEYGVCFNREALGPVYNLTSMTVLAPTH